MSIDALQDHYIICGYGRIGALICREFAAKPIPFVVVESNPAVLEKLEGENLLFLHGNATKDETLLKAGIKRTKGSSPWLRRTRRTCTSVSSRGGEQGGLAVPPRREPNGPGHPAA